MSLSTFAVNMQQAPYDRSAEREHEPSRRQHRRLRSLLRVVRHAPGTPVAAAR
jgi:hypothetical protein